MDVDLIRPAFAGAIARYIAKQYYSYSIYLTKVTYALHHMVAALSLSKPPTPLPVVPLELELLERSFHAN